jgi:hypothetical protein
MARQTNTPTSPVQPLPFEEQFGGENARRHKLRQELMEALRAGALGDSLSYQATPRGMKSGGKRTVTLSDGTRVEAR